MSSISADSPFADLAGPLWLAFHDAGAANLAFAWLQAHAGQLQMRPDVAGPAALLWQRMFADWPVLPSEEAAKGATMLVSGSGWASNLEYDARVLARRCGVRSVAIIDHWVNYAERFTRDGKTVLPDELWVTDAQALALARSAFPQLPVRQWPNRYLENQVAEVRTYAPMTVREPPQEILYVLEPIRQRWNEDPTPGEFQALAFFLDHLPQLGVGRTATICLRPHPSESLQKYADWPARYPHLRLRVDAAEPLARQIADSDWVVGCQTYALVVALAAGRVALSTLPPWAPSCPLPQPDLMHVRQLVQGSKRRA